MGYAKDQLLTYLTELQIPFESYEHPVVMTVEAHAQYVGHMEGGHSKNLFLKDKKHRLYVISALTTTNVDLKVLSQRLGLGKGGLRMAPEEALKDVLQVPLGCVTPFALYNESARSVALLLDQGFKAHKRVFFHPLSNDMTISLTTNDLDKFLTSISKEPAYVDLEAVVSVGKEQLPDLAVHVPTEVTIVSNLPPQQEVNNDIGSQNISSKGKEICRNKENVNPESKSTKKINADKKGTNIVVASTAAVTDVGKLVTSIIDKTSAIIISEITEDAFKMHGNNLGSIVAGTVKQRLVPDLESILILLKNAAYTQGFTSGVGSRSLPK
uniref:YbaK/aminoacyl-tRNA synthetase-associated domain-containing protein n=1 Tax=Araucaria cunninghamii TaxID=56994 RepID=A0A0D6R4G5_ARACU